MGKSIVVCLDGTNNQNETQSTNVHRIYEMLDKSETKSNYYSGVGVGGRLLGSGLDALTGRGLFRIVRAAFTFVRGNYVSGDSIFIFGFSRGAYAARHLAGMISRLGFGLPSETTYETYRRLLQDGAAPLVRQEVRFLGMFDCVPGNQYYLLEKKLKVLNSETLEPGIRNVAHAVSIAERRWGFKPLLFANGGQASFSQVWLPGYHFDVGGDENPPLNSFALWWMLREAYGHGLPLKHIKCPADAYDGFHHGRLGVSLGFLPEIDSEAPGRPREYWWTKRTPIRCERDKLTGVERVGPKPDLVGLDECPRGCGEELFDVLGTDEGSRRVNRMLRRAV